jgi:hypothetical protein
LEIRTLPSIAEGDEFLSQTDAMPGASDMELAMAGPSNISPFDSPPAEDIARIRFVILG